MTDPVEQEPTRIRLARLFGGALCLVGFWFVLHGGLSLLGLFSLERDLQRREGLESPTQRWMAVEALAGLALMVSGIALRLKVAQMTPRRAERALPSTLEQLHSSDLSVISALSADSVLRTPTTLPTLITLPTLRGRDQAGAGVGVRRGGSSP